jgi:hypothetical protein
MFFAPDISYRKIIFDKIDSLSRGYLMGDNLPKNSFGDTIRKQTKPQESEQEIIEDDSYAQ